MEPAVPLAVIENSLSLPRLKMTSLLRVLSVSVTTMDPESGFAAVPSMVITSPEALLMVVKLL